MFFCQEYMVGFRMNRVLWSIFMKTRSMKTLLKKYKREVKKNKNK